MPGRGSAKGRLIVAIGAGAAALALSFVPQQEGRVHHTYADVIGVASYCDGSTVGGIPGKTYTDAECDEVLASDLYRHQAGIEHCVPADLTDGEKAADLSLAYNIGVTAFCRSTAARLQREGQRLAACDAFALFNRAGGRVWPGLVARRAREVALCKRDLP